MDEGGLHLIRPDAALRDAFIDMMHDWRDVGLDRYEAIRERAENDFAGQVDEWLALAERTGMTPETWPQHIFWLVGGKDEAREVLGTITLRPQLPEKVQRTFGHIGYEVRPSERRKGHATWMLTHVLPKARDLGLDRVMLVCTKGHPSTRVIQRNGGVLDGEFASLKLDAICQTWRIDL